MTSYDVIVKVSIYSTPLSAGSSVWGVGGARLAGCAGDFSVENSVSDERFLRMEELVVHLPSH